MIDFHVSSVDIVNFCVNFMLPNDFVSIRQLLVDIFKKQILKEKAESGRKKLNAVFLHFVHWAENLLFVSVKNPV